MGMKRDMGVVYFKVLLHPRRKQNLNKVRGSVMLCIMEGQRFFKNGCILNQRL